MDSLPRKCYACTACQKFVSADINEEICSICGHYEAQHEQFVELQIRNYAKRHLERSFEPNLSDSRVFKTGNSNTTLASSKGSDVTDFLNSVDIRDRLTAINNHETARESLYNSNEGTTFKCTMTIVMMPYVNNNRIISVHSFQWADLEFHGFIKQVLFKDNRPEVIRQTIAEAFPKINECGWRILRPRTIHSHELIPYECDGPITGQTMKLACTSRKRCYIGPTRQNVFNRELATSYSELTNSINQRAQETRSTSTPLINQHTSSSAYRSVSRSVLPEIPQSANQPISVQSISEILPTGVRSSFTEFPMEISQFTTIAQDRGNSRNVDFDIQSSEQFRKDLLKSLRKKYHVNELDTLSFHMEDSGYCLEFFMDWGSSAQVENILQKPIIVMEDAIDTGGVFREVTEIFWDKLKSHEFNGSRAFDGYCSYLIQQNSALVECGYATTIGKLLFWTWIHFGSWPKWLDQVHMQYVIGGKEYTSCKTSLRDQTPYLYNLCKNIKDHGWQSCENDLRFWLNENGLDDEILSFDDNTISNCISEYEIIFKRKNSLEMMKEGFDIGKCAKEIKRFGWFKIENELYLTLKSSEFLKLIDQHYVKMTIAEVPSKRAAREQTYGWFKRWVATLDNMTLERLLKFITGTTRIPSKKITIQWRFASESSVKSNVYCKLPFSRTCTNALILCQDYKSYKELTESFEICLSNSEGFSESSYRGIIGLINSSEDDCFTIPDADTVEQQRIRVEHDETRREQSITTIIDNENDTEIIGLTNHSEVDDSSNGNQIVIDIHREAIGQRGRRRKPKRKANTDDNIAASDQFVNVTAQDFVAENRKKKLPRASKLPNVTTRLNLRRSQRHTRSMTRG